MTSKPVYPLVDPVKEVYVTTVDVPTNTMHSDQVDVTIGLGGHDQPQQVYVQPHVTAGSPFGVSVTVGVLTYNSTDDTLKIPLSLCATCDGAGTNPPILPESVPLWIQCIAIQ